MIPRTLANVIEVLAFCLTIVNLRESGQEQLLE